MDSKDDLCKKFLWIKLMGGDPWHFLYAKSADKGGYTYSSVDFSLHEQDEINLFKRDSEESQAASLFQKTTVEQLRSCWTTDLPEGYTQRMARDSRMTELLELLGDVRSSEWWLESEWWFGVGEMPVNREVQGDKS